MAKKGRKPTRAPQRFAKLYVVQDDGCWQWTAHTNNKGYGTFSLGPIDTGGTTWEHVYAHRYSYELHVGPIPDGKVIDHLCHNRSCVNPEHLHCITHRENILGGVSPTIMAYWTKVCCRGHDLSDPAILPVRSDGGRVNCRECARIRYREGAA